MQLQTVCRSARKRPLQLSVDSPSLRAFSRFRLRFRPEPPRSPGSASSAACFGFPEDIFRPADLLGEGDRGCILQRVRPVLMMPSFSLHQAVRRCFVSRSMAGRSLVFNLGSCRNVPAVGNVSLELWDIFEWSFGWIGFSPAISHWPVGNDLIYVHVDWVPLPVYPTANGKLPSDPTLQNLIVGLGNQSERVCHPFAKTVVGHSGCLFKIAKRG